MPTMLKKPNYPVREPLRGYLARFGREENLPVVYSDLLRFHATAPLYRDGKDTLWQTVIYYSWEMERIHAGLKEIYAILKSGGDRAFMEHLYVDRVDFCSFGNSRPFRIRIVNSINENQDYYYVKRADASRVYGLELEHLLSPNRMYFLTCEDTIIEEHVAGVPGDVFIRDWMRTTQVKIIRLAKELVKFNERCLVRLLGDMRACNFVVDLTPDFEEAQIKIRAMDFDQQSYQGRKNFYLPQFFKENREFVFFCMDHLTPTTARQYQHEEQALILRRMDIIRDRLRELLDVMIADELSDEEKVGQLGLELAEHYEDARFEACESMGELVRHSLETLDERRRR